LTIFYALVLTFLLNCYAEIWSIEDQMGQIQGLVFANMLVVGLALAFHTASQPLHAMGAQKKAWDQVIQMLKFEPDNKHAYDILLQAENYTEYCMWNICGGEVTYERVRASFVLLLQAAWATIFVP
jgi:hypothetical protein